MPDFRTIPTKVIGNVSEVRFYEETVQHVRENHPEVPIILPCVQNAVENAISSPTHVEASHSNSYVYVDAGTTNASGDPLCVPVKSVHENSARVKTVYFAERPAGAKIVWRKNG